MRSLKNQRGFTMIELLVGMMAAAILSYAALSLYTTTHKQLLVQDEIADMQGSMRSSAEVLASAIRKAGYNVPGTLTALETGDTNPDTITVTFDTSVIRGIEVESDMSSVTAAINCTAGDMTGVAVEDWLYIYDPVGEVGEFFQVSGIQHNPNCISHDTTPLSMVYLAESEITKLGRIKFFLNTSDSTCSYLMIQIYGSQPEIFAENIANLNFRYYLNNGSIVTNPATPGDIRMVEIDIEGRTSSRDPELFNQYRTRNFILRVNVRNLGLAQH